MASNKKTQRELFNEIIAALKKLEETDELIAFCEGRIEALNKKTSSRKPTAEQEANNQYKAEILTILSKDTGMTIPEIKEASQTMGDFSPQKMSALLRLMYDGEEKTVRRSKEGKVTRYYLI